MLNSSFIKVLSVSIPNPEFRPNQAGIKQESELAYVTTDSFRMTRVTQKPTQVSFPNTENFLEPNVPYKEVDHNELMIACNLSIDIAKKNKLGSCTIKLNGNLTSVAEGDHETFIPLVSEFNHYEPTKLSAKYLSDFLKAVAPELKDEDRKLEWFQRSPMEIVQFRLVTEFGTIEHGIMPLKI